MLDETEEEMCLEPQKKYFRQRAHSNPLADHTFDYPFSPDAMDWTKIFPILNEDEHKKKKVEIVDVGCGFGGFLIHMSTHFPETLVMGLEIRVKVSDYVMDRIRSKRAQATAQGSSMYQNVGCLRTNAMKHLPNFFKKAQLKKLFFLYPDPHFKKAKHKWRIISPALLAEYAYVLREDGMAYTVTDVEDLHHWMVKHFTEHPLFRRVSEEELDNDVCTSFLTGCSEEGQKVARSMKESYVAVFRRVADPFDS